MSQSDTTTLLQKVERGHNKLSDMNFVWIPFLFLKPKPETRIDVSRISKMAPLFGLYFNAANYLRRWLMGKVISVDGIFTDQIYWTLGFGIWFSFVTAPLWNMRADRLKKKPDPSNESG